jgi:hypothetical protein
MEATETVEILKAGLRAYAEAHGLQVSDQLDEQGERLVGLLESPATAPCTHDDPDNTGQCIYCGTVLDLPITELTP